MREPRRRRVCASIALALSSLGAACGGRDRGSDAGDASTSPCSALLGLYAEGSCTELGAGVESFTPRYVLWSDGATKERFIRLPASSTIDASDPDTFVFPVGTVVWKNFSSGGVRVETRMMRKLYPGLGSSAWELRTFAWNAGGTDVTEVFDGVTDALGTTHDIPSAPGSCEQCHNRGDAVAGFSALQLNHAGSALTLSELIAGGLLSGLPAGFDASQANLPSSLDATAQAAIGYLHANCGNCHRGALGGGGMELWAPIGLSDPAQLPVFATAVGQPTTNYMIGAMRIAPGSPATSMIVHRMASRDAPDAGTQDQMPPLATETVDTAGLATVTAFIEALP